MAKPTHIAAVSIPAFSHQASIVEFSKRLIHLHPDFHITCIFPTIGSPLEATIAFLQTLPPNIAYTFLPPITKNELPDGVPPAVQIQLAVARSMSSFREALISLNSTLKFAALISDLFANESLEIAKEIDIKSYIYFPHSAMALSLFLNLPRLDKEISGEYRDLEDPIKLHGCIPIPGKDLPEHFQDRSSLSYKLILERCQRFDLADGFLLNSFEELEAETISALQDLADGFLLNSFEELEAETISALQEVNSGNPFVYPIGPIVQSGLGEEANGSECLKWLDEQPPKSVLYVSFGSGGTLSQDQTDELALGLQLSGKRFLWVLRAPSDSANAAYLGAGNQDPLQFLPSGFLERTKGQGLVMSSWAPQAQILSHGSVGGFLTHCGWNSTLESLVRGVPIIAWPLFAEQKMNAVLLTEGLRVGLRPRVKEESGIVERDEIAELIKKLMEGKESERILEITSELKHAATLALEENGSSARSLSELVFKWKTFGQKQ